MATNVVPTGGFQLLGFESLTLQWRRLLTAGIAVIILGILALALSVTSTLVTVVVLGVIIAAAGIAQIFNAFSSKGWGGFLMHLLLGILYVMAGLVMIARPAASAVSLTMFLGVFFLASGGIRTVMSILTRYPSWGWMLLSGVVSIILGIVVLRSLPWSGLWVIGTFVGIDLLFAGASLTGMALAARHGDMDRPWHGNKTTSRV